MEGIDLGGATLRLYGDRSALDRELALLKRYTDTLEKQGIKVKFDADTGKASREVEGLKAGLTDLNRILADLGKAAHGDFSGLTSGLGMAADAAANATGAVDGTTGAVSGLAAGALKAIPILGQLGLAAMGMKAIFGGLGAAIGAALAPLEKFSHEADRFNQQVAKGGIFATRAFAVSDPSGNLIEKTSDQMRALRPLISREFTEIHREVAKISGATAAQIQEGFNIILQNAGNLGTAGEDLSKIRNLSVMTAAAMNTLGIPAQQLRSEMMSLMTGNIQVYDELGKSLGFTSERVKALQAQGGTAFYDALIADLEKLYEGQKVMAESLSNVKSNYQDFFETVGAQGGQRLEAGLAGALQTVLNQLATLEKSWTNMFDSLATAMEPVLRVVGQVAAMLVPIGSAIGSIFSILTTGLGPILNMIGSMLAPALELVLGVLNFIAKAIEIQAVNFSKAMKPINALFAVFGDSNTMEVRQFFDLLGQGLENASKWADGLIKKFTELIRRFVEFRARNEANRAQVLDPTTGRLRRLTEDERKERVNDILANFDRRTEFDPGNSLNSKMLSAESKAVFEEISNKNQGWGGRDGSVSHRDLMRAQEIAEVRKRMHENDIKGLEQSLRLMTAQKGLVQAMAELTENRRKIDTARASFAVQVAGSPEVRANAEIAQRELAARQEQDRLQERRQIIQVERQVQDKQAEIQAKQAQMQTTQMEILHMEAQISRDKVKAAIAEQEALLPKLNRAEKIVAENRIRDARTELQHREAIVGQTARAVALAQENEGIVGAIAGIEQQRLSVQEQQLDVMAQQNRLSAEQARRLDEIQRREQDLRREAEQLQQTAARFKADQEDRIKGFEREATELGEQIKLQKLLGEQAKIRADQEVDAASRALSVARSREAADAPGAGIREILTAEVQALAAGQEGMTSVADATKRLYDAREKQLLQEQEVARQQQRLQQEREQSEMRIASLRLRLQQLELAGQLAMEKVRIKQAQVQVERDNLSNSLQVGVNAAGGSGNAVGGMATFGRTGSMDLGAGYGMVDIRGSDRAAVIADARDAIRANTARGQKTWIGGDKTGDVDATNLQGTDLDRVIDQGISRHQNRVRPGVFAIDLIANEGTPLGIPLSNVGNLGGGNGWGGDTPRGNLAIHLGPNSRSGNAPAAPALPPPAAATRPAATPAASGLPTGGVLTPAQLYSVNLAAGFNPADAQRMVAVQLAESGGNSRAFNGKGRDLSYGISQINMLGEMGPERRRQFGISSNEQLYDPLVNARAAKAILDEQGWGAWSVTRNGAITPEMEAKAAQAAAAGAGMTAGASGATALQVVPFTPATTGQQQLEGATQQVGILEQSMASLEETIKQFDNLLSNLVQRQGIESQNLGLQQQGALSNLGRERTEAMVIQKALGSQKAQFYAEVSNTFGGWMSGAIKGALQQARQTGELDLADFAQKIMGGLADRLIEMTTDYIMAPIEKAMKESIFKGLSGMGKEELERLVREEQASQGQLTASQNMGGAVDRFASAVDRMALPGAIPGEGAPPGQQPPVDGALPGQQPTGPQALEVVPWGADPSAAAQSTAAGAIPAGMPGVNGAGPISLPDWNFGPASFPFPGSSEGLGGNFDLKGLDSAFDGVYDGAIDLGDTLKTGARESGQNLSGLQQGLGSALAGIASLGMVFGGIQQIGKGGTGNTISGIGSILGGIGGFMLSNPLGMFGARATGGIGNAGDRLLVGENGPELFDVPANGSFRSHNDLRSAMGSAGGGGNSSNLRLQMHFETSRFMDREWVDREQLEDAMRRAEANGAREGERRGAERALDRIRNSPRTRREIGI